MEAMKVFLEAGKKKVFAVAIEWPGWCRGGRDEETALQTLIDYAPRYAQVLSGSGIAYRMPTSVKELTVVEQVAGNATTDFGAPAALVSADMEPIDSGTLETYKGILTACWQAFNTAVEKGGGVELRKGPRGGGRDLEKIIDHVIDGDRGYLSRQAYKYRRENGIGFSDELQQVRAAIFEALETAVNEGLPERGPRGGIIWPARFFVRRTAWHALDHAWEIEDRIV